MHDETDTIRSYRLVALDGRPLPSFTAGAHIGIVLPSRSVRHYSLINSPRCLDSYHIAVQRKADGRGGSQTIHTTVRPGMVLKLQRPRNAFELAAAGRHLLIGAGIGITPLLSMAAELESRGQRFRLIYCVRTPADVPCRDVIERLQRQGVAQVHFSGGANGRRLDLAGLLRVQGYGEHVYFCGPQPFMDDAFQACRHWDRSNVHAESFSPALPVDGDVAFKIEARRTGVNFQVGASETALQAMRDNGVAVDSVCENGTCGTCKTRYLSGTPDHRDHVLTPAERATHMIVCVSRATEGTIVLDA